MKNKKICALLLAVTMVAGTLAGCGGGSDAPAADTGSTTTEDGGSGDAGTSDAGSAASGDVIELTFFNADANQDDPWTDPVAEAITAATGVKLKTTRPVGGNDESNSTSSIVRSRSINANAYSIGIEFEGFFEQTGGSISNPLENTGNVFTNS